jgi:predicted amidohydrolase YtcJ
MLRQPPTTILCQATVLTMDPRRPQAEAVALRDGRIVAVGSDARVLALRHRATTVLDCRGMTILPGFVDAHLHLRAYASTLLGIDCGPGAVRSLAELRQLLRRHAQRQPPGRWLVGYGYDEFALAERRHPTRWDLDEATPHHPVRLAHRSRHAWVLNSLALAQLGLTRTSPPPSGGLLQRDPASGEPTGLLIDMDAELRRRLPRTRSAAEFREGIRRASQHLLAAGVTTLVDASVSNDGAACEAFQGWIGGGDLGVRVVLLLGAPRLEEALAARQAGGRTPWCRVHGLKIRLDESRGGLDPPPQVVDAQVWRAHRHGLPVAIHALEPPALAVALHAIRQAQARLPRPDVRHRIEHAALCPDACLDELAELRVAVVTQPAFLRHHGPRYLAEIDPAQQPWLYRVKSLLDRGVLVAGSSDAPVVPPRPLEGIASAVTRLSSDGRVIGPDERVDVETALWMFTRGAARACGLEGEVGTVARGRRADLVVLGANPLQVPASALPAIPVRMTIVDGVIRWRADP